MKPKLNIVWQFKAKNIKCFYSYIIDYEKGKKLYVFFDKNMDRSKLNYGLLRWASLMGCLG